MNLTRELERMCRPVLAIAACMVSTSASAQGSAPSTHPPGSVDCGNVASAGNTGALCSDVLSNGTSPASGALLVPESRQVGPAMPPADMTSHGEPDGGNSDGGANLRGNNSTGNNTSRAADRTNENTKAGD